MLFYFTCFNSHNIALLIKEIMMKHWGSFLLGQKHSVCRLITFRQRADS